MIAAKNKYDIVVEKGTWNAPTADEKIVALEAKLESTVKNINKKVSIEFGKKATKKGGANDKGKMKANKSKGQHPKSWPPPKGDEKKEASFNDHTWYHEASVRSGARTSQRNAWAAQRHRLPKDRRNPKARKTRIGSPRN